jgi:uncharacterized protein (TIGR03083 family)
VPHLDVWLTALGTSHRRLTGLVAGLSAEELAGPSYASEWSIAQELAHIGSGAEIFGLFIDAGLAGRPAPGADEFQPVWQRWNAKSVTDQAGDALRTDAALLARFDALDDERRRDWTLSLFGTDQGLADLARLRLGEHAVHTWDIAVTRDRRATVEPAAVELLIDTLGQTAALVAKPPGEPLRVSVTTQQPVRRLVLDARNAGLDLRGVDPSTDALDGPTLQLPAEALIRLVYGRLDADHTPHLVADGVDLDVLRQIFPGF